MAKNKSKRMIGFNSGLRVTLTDSLIACAQANMVRSENARYSQWNIDISNNVTPQNQLLRLQPFRKTVSQFRKRGTQWRGSHLFLYFSLASTAAASGCIGITILVVLAFPVVTAAGPAEEPFPAVTASAPGDLLFGFCAVALPSNTPANLCTRCTATFLAFRISSIPSVATSSNWIKAFVRASSRNLNSYSTRDPWNALIRASSSSTIFITSAIFSSEVFTTFTAPSLVAEMENFERVSVAPKRNVGALYFSPQSAPDGPLLQPRVLRHSWPMPGSFRPLSVLGLPALKTGDQSPTESLPLDPESSYNPSGSLPFSPVVWHFRRSPVFSRSFSHDPPPRPTLPARCVRSPVNPNLGNVPELLEFDADSGLPDAARSMPLSEPLDGAHMNGDLFGGFWESWWRWRWRSGWFLMGRRGYGAWYGGFALADEIVLAAHGVVLHAMIMASILALLKDGDVPDVGAAFVFSGYFEGWLVKGIVSCIELQKKLIFHSSNVFVAVIKHARVTRSVGFALRELTLTGSFCRLPFLSILISLKFKKSDKQVSDVRRKFLENQRMTWQRKFHFRPSHQAISLQM